MAKAKRDVSVHSRAARRGEVEVKQSSTTRKSSAEESDYKPWLHSAQNAGVAKKRTKQLSRQQRLRQQRGLEKAEINIDKLDKKVADSKTRGKKVNARRADWDELNEDLLGNSVKAVKKSRKGNDSEGELAQALEEIGGPDAALNEGMDVNNPPALVESVIAAASTAPARQFTASGREGDEIDDGIDEIS